MKYIFIFMTFKIFTQTLQNMLLQKSYYLTTKMHRTVYIPRSNRYLLLDYYLLFDTQHNFGIYWC